MCQIIQDQHRINDDIVHISFQSNQQDYLFLDSLLEVTMWT